MGKSTWRDRLRAQRRKALLADYVSMVGSEPNDSAIMARLAIKHGLSVTTVYKDLKEERKARNGNK